VRFLKKKLYKILFIFLGVLAVSIAAVSRLIPGVPATPFLLLALYCFNRSSEKLSAKLKNSKLYKKYLAEYVQSRSMTIKQKLFIQIFASIMMTISFIAINNLTFRIVMVVLFLIHHYVFIFRIKTYKPANMPSQGYSNDCSKPSNMKLEGQNE